MKRKMVVFMLLVVLCGGMLSYPSFAEVHGGWDEDYGYFKTVVDYKDLLQGKQNLYQSEPRHTGKREKTEIGGTTNYRAHGWTTWVGVYHYTRARMEEGSRVLTDSDRIWGWDGTEATSPWWEFDPNVNENARTYYGN